MEGMGLANLTLHLSKNTVDATAHERDVARTFGKPTSCLEKMLSSPSQAFQKMSWEAKAFFWRGFQSGTGPFSLN